MNGLQRRPSNIFGYLQVCNCFQEYNFRIQVVGQIQELFTGEVEPGRDRQNLLWMKIKQNKFFQSNARNHKIPNFPKFVMRNIPCGAKIFHLVHFTTTGAKILRNSDFDKLNFLTTASRRPKFERALYREIQLCTTYPCLAHIDVIQWCKIIYYHSTLGG